MKARRRVLVFLITSTMVVHLNYFVVKADDVGRWSPDARVPGYLDDTFTPFLLADQNRTIHAFASQWVVNESRRLAIVHRQWSLTGGWTRPVDILLAPTGDAHLLGAFLDTSDKMHLIFLAGGTGNIAVYYSNTLAASVDVATSWSVPVVVGKSASGVNSAAIVSDDQGNLVIIYSGFKDGSGVYYVISFDKGKSWSEPEPVFLTYDSKLIPYSLHLTLGSERQVRAVWSVVTDIGVDEALYFANFDISNSEWSIPAELDRRIDLPGYFGPSFPAMVDIGTDIIVLYNGGNPYAGRFVDAGRPTMRVIISGDSGLTWNGPANPFPLLNGRSGEHSLVVDSTGGAHGLFTMRIDREISGEYKPIAGIWHSVFQDGIWSNPDRIVTTVAPHDVRAVVSQGNVLLAVWREDPGVTHPHGIWYSYKVLDAPELPVLPFPTQEAVSLSNSVPPEPSLTVTPTALLDRQFLDQGDASRTTVSSPARPLIWGVVPVLVLISVVVIFHELRRHRE